MLPIVIIFDIDGTLIGDISPQVMVYDVLNELKKHKCKVCIGAKDLQSKLQFGILRPHFIQFINDIKKHFDHVEFFIYTASQKRWAEYIIKVIENTTGVKFNRPIFTRNDCLYIDNECKKNLARIKKRMYVTLHKKYRDLKMSDLKDRILMIDNTRVFQSIDDNAVLICPSYEYKYPENMPAIIPRETYEAHYKSIHTNINRYIFGLPLTSSYVKFQRTFYPLYVTELMKMRPPEDRFWLYLRDMIIKKNITIFDAKSVKYMNLKVTSTYKL